MDYMYGETVLRKKPCSSDLIILSGTQNSHSVLFTLTISCIKQLIFCVTSADCGDATSNLIRRIIPTGADCRREMVTWYSNSFRLLYSAISYMLEIRESTFSSGVLVLLDMRIDGNSMTETRCRCWSLIKSHCLGWKISANDLILRWISSDTFLTRGVSWLRQWSETVSLSYLS